MYVDDTDEIIYNIIDGPTNKRKFNLDDCSYLYYIPDISYSTFKSFKKFFNLLVNCKLI